MLKSMRISEGKAFKHADGEGRIFDNQHLLDATEIFRKLNVHKKVSIRSPKLLLPIC